MVPGTDNKSQEIILASEDGDFERVKELLEEGVDVNTRDSYNNCTTLHWASWHGHVDIVKVLLEKGANANLADNDGDTPLHTASKCGRTGIVKMLLDHGVNPNITNKDGGTPLYESVRKPSVTKLLLESGADVNHRDNDGNTALHSQCLLFYGNPEVVKLLLEHGIDRHAKNNDGKTAFELTSDQKILDLEQWSNTEMERLKNEVDRLKSKLANEKRRRLDEERFRKEAEEETAKLEQQLEEQVQKRLQEEVAKLIKLETRGEQKIEKLKGQLEEKDRRLREQRKEAQLQKKEIAKLKQELEEQAERLKRFKRELDMAERSRMKQEGSRKEAQEEAEKVRFSSKKAKEEVENLAKLKRWAEQNAEKLKGELEEKDRRLKQECKEAQLQKEETKSAQEESAKLKQELEQRVERLQRLEKELDMTERSRRTEKCSRKEVQEEFEELRISSQKAKEEVENLTKFKKWAEQYIEKFKVALEEKDRRLREQCKEARSQKEKIEKSAQEEISKLKQELEEREYHRTEDEHFRDLSLQLLHDTKGDFCDLKTVIQKVKLDTKKVVIIGGGPVGLMFAHLLLEYGRIRGIRFNIHMYEGRWKKDQESGEMAWKDMEEGSNRRRQVVTIQSNVWKLLPSDVKSKLFESPDEDYSEMWVYGPDSPKEVGSPRNIPINFIEDKLLSLLQNNQEAIKDSTWVNITRQMPPTLYNKRVDKNLLRDSILPRGMDYMILADGGRAQTESNLNEILGNELFGGKVPFQEDKDMGLRDDVLGIYVELNNKNNTSANLLGKSESMALTVSQNRFLFNPLPGKFGFLNLWLTSEEKELAYGVTSEGQCTRCVQSSPCWFAPNDNGEFVCPTHNAVFAPSRNPENNVLWNTITNGLRLYGIELCDVKQIVKFQLGPYARRTDFCAELKVATNSEKARAFLLGDAAMSVGFFGALRGLNTGLKGAVNLARTIAAANDTRKVSFVKHEGFMYQLQKREVEFRSLLPVNPVRGGNDVGKRNDSVDVATDAKEQFKKRVALIATGTFNENRLPTGVDVPNLDAINSNIDAVDDNFIADLYASQAWQMREAGGNEVNQELPDPLCENDN